VDKYSSKNPSNIYPIPKEWADILNPDVSSSNRWLENPYQLRYAGNPLVEKFIADTYKGRTNLVDKRDKVYRAASEGDLQPYIDHQKYLKDKGILPESARSVGDVNTRWADKSELSPAFYDVSGFELTSPNAYADQIRLFEHDAFSHAYPDLYFGKVAKKVPFVSAADEVRANFLDPFLGRSGVAGQADPKFRTDKLPNPLGENIEGASPYRVGERFWESDLRSRGLSSEGLWNSRLRNALRNQGRVGDEVFPLEGRFKRQYDDSILPPGPRFDPQTGKPIPGMESPFVLGPKSNPDFAKAARARFPETSMQEVVPARFAAERTKQRMDFLKKIFGDELPVDKELNLNPGVYKRVVQKGFLPYAHDLAKAQKLTKYNMAKAGLKNFIDRNYMSDDFMAGSLGLNQLRDFSDNSYFSLDPVTMGGQVLKNNWRGGVVGAGASLLNPEVANRAKEDDYIGATKEFGKDVAIGGLTEASLKGLGGLGMKFAPGFTKAAAPYVGTTLGVVGPGVVGAGIFSQGRDDSLTNVVVDKAANYVPGLKADPDTDIGKRAGDFLANQARNVWSKVRGL
tara:strand:- start:169 stop:1875 length:1707 start_codon:yes stop_codon:yes gene_type:complete